MAGGETLRIGILGSAPGSREWAATLAGIAEVREAEDLEGLLAGEPDVVVLVGDGPEAARIASEIAGRAARPPVTVVVGEAPEGDPRARWLAGLVRGGGLARALAALQEDAEASTGHQERLLRTARLADIGQLAAGIAHEINTPLASIALRAESLLRSAEDPRLRAVDSFEKFPRYLKTIDEEIFRCKEIIAALLEFSRSRKPEVRDADLNALAQKAAGLVHHQMTLKQVELAVRLDPDLPHIRADDGQLRQALIALLMNALDATPAGGRVVVETRREAEGRVSLTVADTGAGIPRENLDRIFTPFFTTKPPGQGAGLGLSVCHGVVAAHGGEIRLDSEVGRGTAVSLVLPVAGAPAAPGGGATV